MCLCVRVCVCVCVCMYVCSVAKSCLALWNSMDCGMPHLLVPHHLPEFDQVHVHRISDDIHPSHALSYLSPTAFNLSQHQGLFQGVDYSHQYQSNDSSRLISSRIDLFDIIAAQETLRRLLGTLPWRHQLFGTLPSLSSKFHILKWLLETLQPWLYRPLSAK